MRAIITVTGKDTTGIIARVCTCLAENDVNILDISQTVMQEFFTMAMLVELEKSKLGFSELSDTLAAIGESMGLVVRIQREDIFTRMHRV
ncbi:MAG: ACT domain-containing protein [Clostridia bacterium]|nr:ACT domain-containing protein [Clostridia bacterium]